MTSNATVGGVPRTTATIIDLASGSAVAGPPVVGSPTGDIEVSPVGNRAVVRASRFVTGTGTETRFVVIDTETGAAVRSEPVVIQGRQEGQLVFNKTGTLAFQAITGSGGTSVAAIDTDTGEPTAAVPLPGESDRGVTIDAGGDTVYLTTHEPGRAHVAVIDPATGAQRGQTIDVAGRPRQKFC